MKILPYFCFIIKPGIMNKEIKAMVKQQVTGLLKEYMAKHIDEKILIEKLNIINNEHKAGDNSVWFRWHEGHPLAITIGDIKAGLTNSHMHNRLYMCECIEATINDNSLVVNFS